jgi:ribosomal protein S18 acetylase RimI-like enzyme
VKLDEVRAMQIRPAAEADFAAIAELQIRSWQDAYRGILPDAYLDGPVEADLRRHWTAARPQAGDLVLVAAADQALVGFITVWCRPDPFIDNLHVDPALRSGGIGARLLHAAMAELRARGHGRVWLYVAAANRRAIAFYERQGGQPGPPQVQHLHGLDIAVLAMTFKLG